MNRALLDKAVQDFITDNLDKPIDKVVLKGSPFSVISIQELAIQLVSKSKCRYKLPTWYKQKGIIYPQAIHIEQSSSEQTANYKAGLIKGEVLVDLTGGFGVDSYCFAQKFKTVLHCERHSELSEIAAHNFKTLRQENIMIRAEDGLAVLDSLELAVDWIYLDPSRRHSDKGKVYLLEDCEPNVLQIQEKLHQYAKGILIKTSPLLDISKAIESLDRIHEVHIVAVGNEVKELLLVIRDVPVETISITAVNLHSTGQQQFSFVYPDDTDTTFSEPLTFLFEPNAAIMKSGAFNHISNSFNIKKLHEHSHIYTANKLIEFPGRRFKIDHVLPYNRKKLKRSLPFSKANITTRNFPESVAQIRKKTGLKDGGDHYLFFTTDLNEKHIVIIGHKV